MRRLSCLFRACRTPAAVIVRRPWRWLVLLVVLWLLLGNILPFLRHTATAAALPAGFSAQRCYGDTPCGERVACIEENADALFWRLRLIRLAQREIIFSCFDLRCDESGRAVMAALLEAADRGVQVRILLDGFCAQNRLAGSRWMAALAAQPGVEVRLYAPCDLARPWQMQTLMHDKYLIADDQAYLLGGRNTYDRFLKDIPGASIDREVLVWQQQPAADSSLAQLRAYFESVWTLEDCVPFRPRAGGNRQAALQTLRQTAAAQLAADPALTAEPDWPALTMPAARVTLLHNPVQPANKASTLWAQLCALMQSGGEVLLQTPYAICSRQMYDDLMALAAGGVDISLLTNAVGSGDNLMGCADYLTQKQRLLDCGLSIYEHAGERSVHTKTVLVGTRLSVIGSYNLDMRSTYLDTELMLAIDCPPLNAALRQSAAAAQDASLHVTADGSTKAGAAYTPPSISALRKLLYGVLAVLTRPLRFLL